MRVGEKRPAMLLVQHQHPLKLQLRSEAEAEAKAGDLADCSGPWVHCPLCIVHCALCLPFAYATAATCSFVFSKHFAFAFTRA